MAIEEQHPMIVEEQMLEHRHEHCGNGMIVWVEFDGRAGKGYWVQNDALQTSVDEAYPDNVDTPAGEPQFLETACQHIEGMFAPGGNRWDTFATLLDSESRCRMKMQEELALERPNDANEIDIPLSVAQAGKTVMFAYFAAHGWENKEIATIFDIKPASVRVNLSKYKNSS
jgi:hypothetical protein